MTKRNLILIHRGPEYEKDFDEIAAKVNALDRDITIYHLPGDLPADLPLSAWQYPTLTIALMSKFKLPIRRGPVLRNRFIDKIAQAEIVRKSNLRYPPLMRYVPGMKLDPIIFGDFVIIKPMTLTSTGEGVQLFRRRRLETMTIQDFPKDHPILQDEMGYIVQKFVDTGEYPSWNRVITFLGKPIYAANGALRMARPSLSSSDEVLQKATVAIQGLSRQREWRVDDDVMEFALKIATAFEEIPLLAIDILREKSSGRLYFLECNPGGNTWHFSSMQPGGVKLRHQLGEIEKNGPERALELGRQRMIDQFDAFNTIAQVLVENTQKRSA
jgi:hypothetical protein